MIICLMVKILMKFVKQQVIYQQEQEIWALAQLSEPIRRVKQLRDWCLSVLRTHARRIFACSYEPARGHRADSTLTAGWTSSRRVSVGARGYAVPSSSAKTSAPAGTATTLTPTRSASDHAAPAPGSSTSPPTVSAAPPGSPTSTSSAPASPAESSPPLAAQPTRPRT